MEDRTWHMWAWCSVLTLGAELLFGPEITRLLSILGGIWAGFFLARAGFRYFGWGKVVANLLWGAGLVGAVAMLTMLLALHAPPGAWLWIAVMIPIGIGGTAKVIVQQRIERSNSL